MDDFKETLERELEFLRLKIDDAKNLRLKIDDASRNLIGLPDTQLSQYITNLKVAEASLKQAIEAYEKCEKIKSNR